MKPPRDSLERNLTALDDYNYKQMSTVRAEADEVKKCFTTQSHHAYIFCAAVLGFSARIDSLDGLVSVAVMFTAISTIVLLLATLQIGCHKYNTANRALAFEIHLARVVEYEEALDADSTYRKVAQELRRISWEQAMFAWRVVQPVIFDFFYRECSVFGICAARFKRGDSSHSFRWPKFAYEEDLRVADAVREYPWYDSREMLRSEKFHETLQKAGLPPNAASAAQFYPGSYLRKSAITILGLVLLFYIIFIIGAVKTWHNYPAWYWNMLVGLAWFAITYYAVVKSLNRLWRANILESGLLSIQTSAFVWRMVCLSHLKALHGSRRENRPAAAEPVPLYNKYTMRLATAACSLRAHLHDVHPWLCETEKILSEPLAINRDAATSNSTTAAATIANPRWPIFVGEPPTWKERLRHLRLVLGMWWERRTKGVPTA